MKSTTVGVSGEEEPVEWNVEDYKNICDNLTGQRLSPEALQIRKAGRAGVDAKTRSLEGSSG